MFIANVEFTDDSQPEEMRGYQQATYAEGVAQFMWDNELVVIPLHRIKSIVETKQVEGQD